MGNNEGENMSQIGNALKMLILLQSRNGMKISEIAEELEVDERSVRRYKDDLEQAGIYIWSERGKNGGYKLADSNYLLGIGVSQSEFYSLQLVQKQMKDSAHITSKDLNSIVQKLEHVLNKQKSSMQNLASHMEKASPSTSNLENERSKLLDFHAAILQGKKVKMSYVSLGSGKSERVVRPYATFEYVGDLYLIGFCEKRSEILEFKLCRIESYEVLEECFERDKDFTLESYLHNCFGVFKDKELDVRLRVKHPMAQVVRERVWVANQRITELGDGEILFEARMRGKTEIVNWVLGMKGDGVVLEPRELVEAVRDAAQKVLEKHL